MQTYSGDQAQNDFAHRRTEDAHHHQACKSSSKHGHSGMPCCHDGRDKESLVACRTVCGSVIALGRNVFLADKNRTYQSR
jgi:hypothetical protein